MKKMTRLEANRAILTKLAEIIEANPNWRFHQILQNFNIVQPRVDRFYEESTETLKYLIKIR